MKLGICLPHYGRPIEVGRMLEVARRTEERGLDSVWVTDHVIVPEQANVIYREDMLDPLAVLPWLAGVTSRVALGTSVVILPYRTPIPVAKLLASVDVLSGGRLIVGAAIGWLEGEFEALGVPFKERASRSDEALELMRTVWTQEHPKIQTKRHRVQDVVASPMPLQKPRPPLYIGGSSEAAYRRVARLGDGWHASSTTHDAFRQGADAVRRFWKEAGREGAPYLSLRIPILIDGVHRPGGRHGADARSSHTPWHTEADRRGARGLRGARLRPRRPRGLVLDVPGDPRDDRYRRRQDSPAARRVKGSVRSAGLRLR
jgi:probable F420-dependent oxidoreductase